MGLPGVKRQLSDVGRSAAIMLCIAQEQVPDRWTCPFVNPADTSLSMGCWRFASAERVP